MFLLAMCCALNYETWCSEVFCSSRRTGDVLCECAPEKGVETQDSGGNYPNRRPRRPHL